MVRTTGIAVTQWFIIVVCFVIGNPEYIRTENGVNSIVVFATVVGSLMAAFVMAASDALVALTAPLVSYAIILWLVEHFGPIALSGVPGILNPTVNVIAALVVCTVTAGALKKLVTAL